MIKWIVPLSCYLPSIGVLGPASTAQRSQPKAGSGCSRTAEKSCLLAFFDDVQTKPVIFPSFRRARCVTEMVTEDGIPSTSVPSSVHSVHSVFRRFRLLSIPSSYNISTPSSVCFVTEDGISSVFSAFLLFRLPSTPRRMSAIAAQRHSSMKATCGSHEPIM